MVHFHSHRQVFVHMMNCKYKSMEAFMSDLTATNCGGGCGCSTNERPTGLGNNSCIWIILLLLCCGGCGGSSRGGFGCGDDCLWIIILLFFCGGCGNHRGGCEDSCY